MTGRIAQGLEALAVPVDSLSPLDGNPRRGDVARIAKSLARFGQRKPIVVRRLEGGGGEIIAGNHTYLAAQSLGWSEIAAVFTDDTRVEARAFALADNRTSETGSMDDEALVEMLAELGDDADLLDDIGYGVDDIDALLAAVTSDATPDSGPREPVQIETLAERFLLPPFTVLDQRGGRWQDRKRQWVSLGIKSEVGRADGLAYGSQDKMNALMEQRMPKPKAGVRNSTGTSIFDPVLCEISYAWFSAPGAAVLDPFAGGSVRGVVAAVMDRHYTGIDLSAEQIQANREQYAAISQRGLPGSAQWMVGDALLLPDLLPDDYMADLVLSCPPYADLEVYSDDPADLSNMPYDQFVHLYRQIIRHAVDRLRDDRFAVWVVGEVRDKDGHYRGLVPDTVRAFEDAGARFYNEGILVSPVGSLSIRASRPFLGSRKLGKTHQQVLVFVKGSAKQAAEWCGPVTLPEWEEDGDPEALLP